MKHTSAVISIQLEIKIASFADGFLKSLYSYLVKKWGGTEQRTLWQGTKSLRPLLRVSALLAL